MFKKISAILSDYSNGKTITPDTNLTNDLALDSIDRAEIGVLIEDSLGLPEGILLHEDVMAARTVRDLVILIEHCAKYKDLKLNKPALKPVNLKQPGQICSQTGKPCNKITHLRAVDNNVDFCNIVKCKIAETYLRTKTK